MPLSTLRWLALAALIPFVVGAALVAYAHTLPVYTDARAVERLAIELATKSPGDKDRSTEWYSQLHRYETAHKALSDWGRGLIAAAVGLEHFLFN